MAFQKTPKEYIERHLRMYLGRHSSPGATESYEFNIKIQQPVHIPEEIRVSLTGQAVDEVFWDEAATRLENFANGLRHDYAWISSWAQVGRSGGWLVLGTNDPVLDEAGKIQDYKHAERRLFELQLIEIAIVRNKNEFVEAMESFDWWRELFPTLFRVPPGIKEWRPPE